MSAASKPVSGRSRGTAAARLPLFVAPAFWDRQFRSLSWERDRDFIIRRILEAGDWRSVNWLRTALGDNGLRAWLSDPVRRPGGLSRRQIRFWEIMLVTHLGHLLDEARRSPWPH